MSGSPVTPIAVYFTLFPSVLIAMVSYFLVFANNLDCPFP